MTLDDSSGANIRAELLGQKIVVSARLVTRSDDGYVAISLREMSRAAGEFELEPDIARIFTLEFRPFSSVRFAMSFV